MAYEGLLLRLVRAVLRGIEAEFSPPALPPVTHTVRDENGISQVPCPGALCVICHGLDAKHKEL
jgi:hypothetical protein